MSLPSQGGAPDSLLVCLSCTQTWGDGKRGALGCECGGELVRYIRGNTMGNIERYAVSAAAGYYVVTDSEQPAHAPTIAKCDRLDDARRIASALNDQRGAVDLLRESLGGPDDGAPADAAWHDGWVERVRAFLATSGGR